MAPINLEKDDRPLRIILVSSSDPLDVHSFSGTIFYMARALRDVFPKLEIIRRSRSWWFPYLQRWCVRLTRGKVDPYYWQPLNKWFAKKLAHQFKGTRVVVIAVVNAALVSELANDVPIINVSDATYDLMRTEHLVFWSLGDGAAARAEIDEWNSIRLSVHSSFSSSWAARSAIGHYGADPGDVSVISWGCNFDNVPEDEVREKPDVHEPLRLLFIGGEWERKGGDVVCAVGDILAAKGIQLQVDAIGALPPAEQPAKPWLTCHGYLSKSDVKQAATIRSLMRDADLLFLPTRRDCTPMVFAEANAYGTPALTRDVGGVADVVHDGVNGIVLPEDADAAQFASAIEALLADRDRYASLRVSSREEYDTRLNWRAWAGAIVERVDKLKADGRI